MKVNDKKTVIQSSGYDGSEILRVCPKCNEEKTLSMFGFRKMSDGSVRNQSYCKKCRSQK